MAQIHGQTHSQMLGLDDNVKQNFTREQMQQITTTLAAMWKEVSEEEKESCAADAAVLKQLHSIEKLAFEATLAHSGGAFASAKKTKAKKMKKGHIVVQGSGEKPRRARTAYLIYCGRYRGMIMDRIK